MKKYLYFLNLMLGFSVLMSCKSSAVFDTDAKVKVLYTGIMNQVYIRNPDIHKIKFTAKNAHVSILNDTTLLVTPQARGRVDLKLEYKGATRVLPFRVQEIPKAKLTFRGRVYDSDTPMPVNEARATSSAQVTITDFAYDCRIEFLSMDVIHLRDDKVLYRFTTGGSALNGVLQRANVGDTYVFSNIKLKLAGGPECKGEDVVLKIVEAGHK